MIRRLLGKRSLEHSLAIAVGLLVVVLIGTTMLLVHSRVAASLRKEMGARGFSIARSIGAVATPSRSETIAPFVRAGIAPCHGAQPLKSALIVPVPRVSVRKCERKPMSPRDGTAYSMRTRPLPT